MFQRFIQTLKSYVDLLPHWVLLVVAAGVGAVFSKFQAEPNEQIISALTHWGVAVPMLKGAAVAFVGTVLALLKTAPWSGTSGGGSVTRDSREFRTVPPSKPPVVSRIGFGHYSIKWPLAGFCALLVACLIPPSPAQQEQDAESLAACVATNWGQPVPVVAANCTHNAISVAQDAIADFEALFEKRAVAANGGVGAMGPFPYAGDLVIEAKLVAARKRVAASQ